MNWETLSSPSLEIRDIKKTIRDSEIHLTWFWPKEVDFIYIYKAPSDQLKPFNEIHEQDVLLFTREEYKVNQGYVGKLESMGRFGYRIFPCQKRDGPLITFNQENDHNLIYISGPKAMIYYSITYKNKLFQQKKKVRMSIMTDIPVDKELLVYVKKKGSVPVSIDDGTMYPFVRDFPSGKSVPCELEIEKHEYIKLFFNKGNESAHHFDLIHE